MRAALGCLLGSGRRGCLCGWGVDGACRPLSSKPMTHSLWPHPRAQIWGQAGQAAGATQVRVGPPRGSPRSLGVYWVPGLHMLDPPSDPFIQRRQLRPGGHGGGGLLLALRLPPTTPPRPHPASGLQALRSPCLGAPGGTRWAGGRGRNILPRVWTGPGGRWQLLAPPCGPPSAERSWHGWPCTGKVEASCGLGQSLSLEPSFPRPSSRRGCRAVWLRWAPTRGLGPL